MANILIAIATLSVGFILATYGAYSGYYSMKRAEYATRVSNGFELALVYVYELKEDIGRVPVAADIDAERIEGLGGHGILYRYGNGTAFDGTPFLWVCARAPTNQPYIEEAFRKVAEQRSGTAVGENCQNQGAAGESVAITVRID